MRYAQLKGVLERGLAGVALAGSAPLLVAVSVAIALDSPGPIVFKQQRLGKHGKVFSIWKFRTMQDGASVVVDARGDVLNPSTDARVTRVGRVLRKFSLDELPQLVNVVRGDMSLVGPRPDLPIALELYDGDERRKLEVLPGITGLSQVSGRNALDAHEKWSIDVNYVDGMSFGLDVRILLRTVANVILARGISRNAP